MSEAKVLIPEELKRLASLVKLYDTFQDLRIVLNNKVRTLDIESEALDTIPVIANNMLLSEKIIAKEIEREVRQIDVYREYLRYVKGLGAVLSAKLICYIKDIERFATVAKLWRYAGLGVVDGKAERRRRGQKANYNTRFKALMYVIANSFLKTGSKYRIIYDRAKEYYTANRDWNKSHIHYAALRRMEKLFLAHVWEKWREIEGLPTREPYPIEYLGHITKLEPEEFMG